MEAVYRLIFVLIVVSLLAMGLYFRIRAAVASKERLSRREEGMLVFLLLRLAGLGLWIGMFAYMISPRSMAWSSMALPAWLRWLGGVLALLSLPLLHWVLRTLGTNLTDTVVTRAHHTLVTTGPYRWVRHPFYLAAALLSVSISLLAANWFMLLMVAVAYVMVRIRTPIEERKLVEKFGADYQEYMRRTGRFFPRFRS